MKKAGKFVSYLLVMALVTSLLSGLGIKAEKANAKITAGKFTVLEIVPHKTMGTFGYLVDGYFGRNLNQAENHSDIQLAYAGDTHLRSYLIGAGLCEDNNTEYISTNYFEENVLKTISDINWDVTVLTRTPKNLNEADINAADMIVINQTVPADLKKSGVTVKTFRDENCRYLRK